MTRHVFYTWLLANLLHPIIFFAQLLFETGEGDMHVSFGFLDPFLLFVMASCAISLPGLLVARPLFGLIIDKAKDEALVFVLWLVSVAALAFLSFVAFSLLIAGSIELLELSIPAVISSVLAVAFRFYQLKQLIQKQNEPYEQDVA